MNTHEMLPKTPETENGKKATAYEKVVLPPDYQQMPSTALAKLSEQMEDRIRQIDAQIKDALAKNPRLIPARYGSVMAALDQAKIDAAFKRVAQRRLTETLYEGTVSYTHLTLPTKRIV